MRWWAAAVDRPATDATVRQGNEDRRPTSKVMHNKEEPIWKTTVLRREPPPPPPLLVTPRPATPLYLQGRHTATHQTRDGSSFGVCLTKESSPRRQLRLLGRRRRGRPIAAAAAAAELLRPSARLRHRLASTAGRARPGDGRAKDRRQMNPQTHITRLPRRRWRSMARPTGRWPEPVV